MFRRSVRLRVPFADARKLFFAADGGPLATPVAPLFTVLSAIQANYRAVSANGTLSPNDREALVEVALHHVVMLDSTDADSELLVAWTEESSEPEPNRHCRADSGAVAGVTKKPVHTIVQVMQTFPNNIPIRERCCRCLANMCQLGNAGADATHVSQFAALDGDPTAESQRNAAYYNQLHASVAERLVQEGAVEQALGTLRATQRLSRRGRCWAALAVLNLTCLSRSGASKAAAAGGEDALAEFILFILDDATSVDGVVRDEGGLTAIALDAALGALTGVLAAEAPENDKGVSYNYEKISYTAVDAVVHALLATSLLVVRDGRNDGAYNATLPSRRGGASVHFAAASQLQRTTVATLLPHQHKGWMALQQAASHAANVPVIFDALYEAASANQERGGRFADDNDVNDVGRAKSKSGNGRGADGASGGGHIEEMEEVRAKTERRYVAALSNLLESALFLVTELEGLSDVSAQLAQLQRDLSLSVLDVMAAMTSAKRRSVQEAVTQEAATAHHPRAGGDVGEETETEFEAAAVAGVTGVLASGLVSSMALATAVRLHTEHQASTCESQLEQRRHEAPLRSSCSTGSPSPDTPVAPELVPYSSAQFTLLSKSLAVLSNLSGVEDEVATSANTVAALQAMLRDAVALVKALPARYRGNITSLFRPVEEDVNGKVIASSYGESSVAPEHRLALLQHLALVGQVYAILCSVLRTPQGVGLVTELGMVETASEMQECLVKAYGAAIQQAKDTYGHAVNGDGKADPDGVGGANAATWVATTAEESVERLTRLGEQLLVNLHKLTTRPGAAMK